MDKDSEPLLLIDNYENELSEWLLLEYRHSTEIWKNIFFSGIPASWDKSIFPEYSEKHAKYIVGKRIPLILDPKAEKPLVKEDFNNIDVVIVGGILGYEKFTGRTYEYITKNFEKRVERNLGNIQLSIDSAVLVLKLIHLGIKLHEIELTDSVEIKWNQHESTVLPYGYVVIDKKVLITPDLVTYLKKRDRA